MTAILGTAATFTLAVNYYFDAGVLIFVLVINCAIGFAQELKSEKTMDALRRMASPTARIVRNKEIHCIATRNVAPGDIIVLELGDVVPADVRVFEAVSFISFRSTWRLMKRY